MRSEYIRSNEPAALISLSRAFDHPFAGKAGSETGDGSSDFLGARIGELICLTIWNSNAIAAQLPTGNALKRDDFTFARKGEDMK
jgi:hypothetical protein